MRKVLIPMVAVVMALAAQPGARAQNYTTVQFSNATGSPVDAWMGVQPASAGRIGQARLIDIVTQQQVPFSDVTPDGLLGKFTLQANQTVSFDSFSGGATHGGAITFRAPPQSCPVNPGAPCGVTKGEFTINNGNESVDISSVDGINAVMSMDLSNGGSNPWPSDPRNGSRVAQNSGTLTGDKTAWGVFPYRCTQCAAIGAAPPTDCNPLGPAQQSYCKDGTESDPQPVKCQLNRTAGGGVVKFTFQAAMDPVHADFNHDGVVDISDYGIWRQNVGASSCGNTADANGDCLVDIRDYGVWRQLFDQTSGGAAPASPASPPARGPSAR